MVACGPHATRSQTLTRGLPRHQTSGDREPLGPRKVLNMEPAPAPHAPVGQPFLLLPLCFSCSSPQCCSGTLSLGTSRTPKLKRKQAQPCRRESVRLGQEWPIYSCYIQMRTPESLVLIGQEGNIHSDWIVLLQGINQS